MTLPIDRNEYESAAAVLVALRTTMIIGFAIRREGDSMRQRFNREFAAMLQDLYLECAEREGMTEAEINRDLEKVENEVSEISHESNSRN